MTHSLASVPGVRAAFWGDLDDDGLATWCCAVQAGGTQIWRQASAGPLADAGRARAASASPDTDIVDGAAFDADHDGDLDHLARQRGRGPTSS